jgi:hypothetical protein
MAAREGARRKVVIAARANRNRTGKFGPVKSGKTAISALTRTNTSKQVVKSIINFRFRAMHYESGAPFCDQRGHKYF